VIQGSPEWLEWRKKGFGSSDAAVLLGLSPWRTFAQLLAEKRGLFTPTFNEFQLKAMERGKRLEPVVRAMTEAYSGLLFPADNEVLVHPIHPFMRASLDGANREQGQLIEIKCGNRKDHVASIGGKVPDKYMPQIQWQLMVSGLKDAVYVSWSGPDEAIEDFTGAPEADKKNIASFLVYETNLTFTPIEADPIMQAELEARAIWAWELLNDPTKAYTFIKWIAPK
jgi:putative phage-type endonuclease